MSDIQGSQRAGRISEEDVKKFIKTQVTVNQGKVEKKEHVEEYCNMGKRDCKLILTSLGKILDGNTPCHPTRRN